MAQGDDLLAFTVKEILVEFRATTLAELQAIKENMKAQDRANDERFKPLEKFQSRFPTVAVLAFVTSVGSAVFALIHG